MVRTDARRNCELILAAAAEAFAVDHMLRLAEIAVSLAESDCAGGPLFGFVNRLATELFCKCNLVDVLGGASTI